MNASSEKRLSEVMPELSRRVRQIISAASLKGVTLEVTQGYRTFAEQDALWARGRSTAGPPVTDAKGGQSYHNYGLAVDLCPCKGGEPDWDDARAFQLVGELALRVGLEWGGTWKKSLNRPHVQLSPLSIVRCLSLYRGGGLPLVWSAVELELGK